MHFLMKVSAIPAAAMSLLAAVGVTKVADPYCNVASEWVKAHKGELPSTYAEISKYPLIYRRYIASELPREIRNQMWKEHLESFLSSKAGLTAEQATLVRYVIANEAVVFDSARGKQWVESEKIADRAKALFGTAQAKAIFATLGPTSESAGNLEVNTASLFGPTSIFTNVARAIAVGAGGTPNCDCSTQSDYCDGSSHCQTGPTKCTVITSECGTIGWYDCNGLCYGVPAAKGQ